MPADWNPIDQYNVRQMSQIISTVAGLPLNAPSGSTAWAYDGCKIGEQPPFGTGVEVYFSNGAWRALSTDLPVVGSGNLPQNTSLPVISGVLQVGQMLTSTNGTWTNGPVMFNYQWNRFGGSIPGATSSSYFPVSADVGFPLTITVTAQNTIGKGLPATSLATSPIVGLVPINTVLPSISGTVQVGQTLTASSGTWTNIPTNFAYQWNRGGVAIVGATSSTYAPVAVDVGTLISVTIIASNSAGSSTPATSLATIAVIDIIPTNSIVPTISGTAQVGQTLSATTGTWTHNPTSYSYQWKSAGVNATGPGATSISYTAVVADIGNALTVYVTATNSGGSSVAAFSLATANVIAAGAIPSNTVLPAVSGTAQVGQTLSTTNGTWTNSPTGFSYQWKRGAVAVGTNISTYVIAVADLGATITCSVTASNASGSSVAATSSATATVVDIIPTITTAPSLSGTPQQGVSFTATAGVWTHNPTSIARQWQSNGVNVGTNSLSYTPVAGDVGHTLTITETATNTGGTSSGSTSLASATVVGTGANSTTAIVLAIAA